MIQWQQLDQTTFVDHFIAFGQKEKVLSVCLVPSAEVLFAIKGNFFKTFFLSAINTVPQGIVNTEIFVQDLKPH